MSGTRRQKNEELEAARIRTAILEGLEDVLRGNVVEYRGNLRSLLHRGRGPAPDCRVPNETHLGLTGDDH